ncbi:MAG: hypothetical protein JWO48_2809 [Bryobacterales bacterium]|nr:hypothetical protein [Bryobacterales bacterium]
MVVDDHRYLALQFADLVPVLALRSAQTPARSPILHNKINPCRMPVATASARVDTCSLLKMDVM